MGLIDTISEFQAEAKIINLKKLYSTFATITVIMGCVCCSCVLAGQMSLRFLTEINVFIMPAKENELTPVPMLL